MSPEKRHVESDSDSDASASHNASASKRRRTNEVDTNVNGTRRWDNSRRAGYIKRITMINFMCHEQLELDFIPGMNFITGKNGSGKSTILTALSTCLGGKASATNRGNSLKSLIKEGKQSAKITLALHNEGINAFQPDRYGKEIVIERRLHLEAPSTYRVANAMGKTISTAGRDVRKITDAFAIFVDNPFAILTQDTARSFLASSSGTDKYIHLKRAMLMDKIELANEKAENNMVDIYKVVSEQFNACQEKKKELNKINAKANEFREAITAAEQKEKYQAQLAWNKVTKKLEEIDRANEKILEVSQKLEDMQSEKEGFGEKQTRIQREQRELEASKEEKDDERRPLLQEIENFKDQERKLRGEQKSLRDDLNSSSRGCASVEDKIKEYTTQKQDLLERDIYSERREQEKQLKQIKEDIKQSKDEVEAKEAEIEENDNEIESAKAEVNSKSGNLRELSSKVKEFQNQIRQIRQSSSEKIRAYGDQMGQVLKQIEKTSFQDRPIGPLGEHISLKSEFSSWSPILEQALNNSLNSFIVFNHADREKLDRILKSSRLRSQIAVRHKDLFEFPTLPDKFDTILKALDITDQHVVRCLIDYEQIEATILIKDRQAAVSTMRTTPNGVNSCIAFSNPDRTKNGVKVTKGGSGTNVIFEYGGIPRMTKDVRLLINKLEQDLKATQEEELQAKRDIAKLENNLKKLRDKKVKLGTELTKLKVHLQKQVSEEEDLSGELSEEIDDQALARLDHQIKELEEEKAIEERQMENLAQQIREVAGKIKDVECQRAAIKEQVDTIDEQKSKLDIRVEDLQSELAEMIERHGKHDSAVEKITQKLADMNSSVAELKEQRDRLEAEAQKLHEKPLELEMSVDKITDRIEKIEELMMKVYQGNQNIEDIVDRQRKAKHDYEELKSQLRVNRDFLKQMKAYKPHRQRHQEMIQERTISMIKRYFRMNLKVRGYSGSVEVDHEQQKLVLKVATANSEVEQDVNKLSGGEKSYSQVSLLAAIWQAMDSKLLALDEFDVFMDKINRRISLKLVIKVLKEMDDTQSIFITPQELESGELNFDSDDIHVVRMDDPERSRH